MMLEPFTWPATGPTASVRVSNNRAVQSNEQHSGPGDRAVPAAITDGPAAESLASGVVPPRGLKECGLSLGTRLCLRKRGDYTRKSVGPHGYEISGYRPH
jgi:hypothetical protein